MDDLSGPESIFIAGALHAKRKFPSNQFVAHDSNRNEDLLSIEISMLKLDKNVPSVTR
jgi:hypothetical protein